MKEADVRRAALLLKQRDTLIEWWDDTMAADDERDARPFIVFQEISATDKFEGDRSLQEWSGGLTLQRELVGKMFEHGKALINAELAALGVEP